MYGLTCLRKNLSSAPTMVQILVLEKVSVADCTTRFSVLGSIRATAVVKDAWNHVEKQMIGRIPNTSDSARMMDFYKCL